MSDAGEATLEADELIGELVDEETLEADIAELQALAGPPGPPGPPGPAGAGGGGYYVHEQAMPEGVWTVVHNLGRYPAVGVIDSAGEEVEVEVIHLSVNALEVRVSAPFSGRAVCN